MARLLKDEEIRVIEKREDLHKYLEYRKENDIWACPYIREIEVLGIPNEEIMIPHYLEEHNLEDTEAIRECIEGKGIFLRFPVNGKTETFPTREIAFSSICQRAGVSGSTFTNFKDTSNSEVLPLEEKASALSRFMKLKKAKANILVRDEKVSTANSTRYSILDTLDLVNILEDHIKEEHPDYDLDMAEVSHEFFVAFYHLNNAAADGELLNLFREFNEDVASVKTGVCLFTSDVADSSASAYPFYEVDGCRIKLGKKIGVKHVVKQREDDDGDENQTLLLFREEIKTIASSFSEAEDQIERLGNLDINDVGGTVERIVEDINSIASSASYTKDAINAIYLATPAKGNGMDVYLSLLEVAKAQKESKSFGPKKYLEIMEEVSSFLFKDIKAYDLKED